MKTTAKIARVDGGWLLVKDGTLMSHISFDPRDLVFPYMSTIGAMIAALDEGPLRMVHIGGGAYSLARHVSALRPGSVHEVAEPDEGMIQLVEEVLPWPLDFNIHPLPFDGATLLQGLRSDSRDLVIMDAFDGYETPDDLKTETVFEECWRVLRPEGLLIANIILDKEDFIEVAGSVFGSAMEFTIGSDEHKNTLFVMGKATASEEIR